MVSSSQVSNWFGQGDGNLSNPSRNFSGLLKNSDVLSTTGSPTINNYSSNGINYRSYSFTGSGTITFTKSGLVDVLCIAGGGGGGSDASGANERQGGGGAGGYLNTVAGESSGGLTSIPSFYVSSGVQTVVIGAGGTGANAANFSGNSSFISSFTAVGGGRGASVPPGRRLPSFIGGSGGGGSQDPAHQIGAAGLTFQGFSGGSGGTTRGGGGGGAGQVGSGGSGTTGGNGGAGLSSSINGTSTSRGGGGGGSGAVPGTATSGGGNAVASGTGSNGAGNTGGGGGAGIAAGGNGGSGIVIIRVLA
jgi:hypothetical protein